MSKRLKPVPTFASEFEERAFWESRQTGRLLKSCFRAGHGKISAPPKRLQSLFSVGLTGKPPAFQDEKLGLVCSTRVKLARDTIRVENNTVRLSPGMAVMVEFKTGKRRVIEYFLSPLMQYGSESLRER